MNPEPQAPKLARSNEEKHHTPTPQIHSTASPEVSLVEAPQPLPTPVVFEIHNLQVHFVSASGKHNSHYWKACSRLNVFFEYAEGSDIIDDTSNKLVVQVGDSFHNVMRNAPEFFDELVDSIVKLKPAEIWVHAPAKLTG